MYFASAVAGQHSVDCESYPNRHLLLNLSCDLHLHVLLLRVLMLWQCLQLLICSVRHVLNHTFLLLLLNECWLLVMHL